MEVKNNVDSAGTREWARQHKAAPQSLHIQTGRKPELSPVQCLDEAAMSGSQGALREIKNLGLTEDFDSYLKVSSRHLKKPPLCNTFPFWPKLFVQNGGSQNETGVPFGDTKLFWERHSKVNKCIYFIGAAVCLCLLNITVLYELKFWGNSWGRGSTVVLPTKGGRCRTSWETTCLNERVFVLAFKYTTVYKNLKCQCLSVQLIATLATVRISVKKLV